MLPGSGAALVLAYVLRFLAIQPAASRPGSPRSARLSTWRRAGSAPAGEDPPPIHLPYRAGARVGGDARLRRLMKELPATLLLRPFNFETLATALYGEAKRGTYEVGAVAALAIVLVGLVPVIVLARVNAASRFRTSSNSRTPPNLSGIVLPWLQPPAGKSPDAGLLPSSGMLVRNVPIALNGLTYSVTSRCAILILPSRISSMRTVPLSACSCLPVTISLQDRSRR